MGTPSHSIVRENRGPVLWYTQCIADGELMQIGMNRWSSSIINDLQFSSLRDSASPRCHNYEE